MNWRLVLTTLFVSLFALSSFAVGVTPNPSAVSILDAAGANANGTVYTLGRYYSFNISWTNTTGFQTANDSIVFNLDGVNHTLASGNGSNQNATATFLAAGNHGFYFFANDTNNDKNQTINYTFQILQNATANITLHLNSTNANFSVTVGQTVNTSVLNTNTAYATTVSLLRNGTSVQGPSAPQFNNSTLETAAGTTVNWTASFAGDENYTKFQRSLFVTVGSNLNWTNNGTFTAAGAAANGSVYTLGQYISFNASLQGGLAVNTTVFNFNGTNVSFVSGASNFSLTTMRAGDYTWYFFFNDSGGNKNQTDTFGFRIVQNTTANITLHLNSTNANFSVTVGQTVNTSVLNTNTAYATTVSLLRNGTSVQGPSAPQFNNSTLETAAGTTVNWTASFAGDENYTKFQRSLFVTTLPNLNWTSNSTSPANLSTFVYGGYQAFNASLQGGLAVNTTVFNLNGTNSTAVGAANFSSTKLRAGYYTWYLFFNDTGGNKNQTDTFGFRILLDNSSLVLHLIGAAANAAVATNTIINITILSINTSYGVNTTIWRNGGQTASSGIPQVTLVRTEGDAGNHNYTGAFVGDENYTSTTTTLFLNASAPAGAPVGSGGGGGGGSSSSSTEGQSQEQGQTEGEEGQNQDQSQGESGAGGGAGEGTTAVSIEAPSSLTQGDVATITVVDANGEGVAGVFVTVTLPDGSTATIGPSDANGHVTFTVTQTGSYGFGLQSGAVSTSSTSSTSGRTPAAPPVEPPVAPPAAAAELPVLPIAIVVILALAGAGYWYFAMRGPKGL